MFLELENVLNANELGRLRQLAAEIKFVDGRVSNPAAYSKNNTQADVSDARSQEASKILLQALARNPEFQAYAMPDFIAPPLVCKYNPSMNYGPHSDAAFMTISGRRLRSDLSCTIFLADPATYEGGELTIHLIDGILQFKCQPGTAVIYPSWTIHEVRPVTKGERLVAITFIESVIKDPQKREMLWTLNEVSELEGNNMHPSNRTRLEQVRQNLLRLWS
ncbi:MAG: Fe2+-dependent dioxygenase [Parvularculaceae bacterium]